MAFNRLPRRDPRTVARDIPGVLDILFPRLTGGYVRSLNKDMFSFEGITPVPDDLVDQSKLQKAMLFELSMARSESLLKGEPEPDWDECLQVASERQRRHYDATIPDGLEESDKVIASLASQNLVAMLKRTQSRYPDFELEQGPMIPGLGWIATGNGDFALGPILIEVKHTDRNFVSGDFRQVMMYWLLRYARALEDNSQVWTDVLLLNPRRNCALTVGFDHLLRNASGGQNRIELFELIRSIVGQELDRR